MTGDQAAAVVSDDGDIVLKPGLTGPSHVSRAHRNDGGLRLKRRLQFSMACCFFVRWRDRRRQIVRRNDWASRREPDYGDSSWYEQVSSRSSRGERRSSNARERARPIESIVGRARWEEVDVASDRRGRDKDVHRHESEDPAPGGRRLCLSDPDQDVRYETEHQDKRY